MKLNRSKIISIIALLIATAIAVVFLFPKLSLVNDQEGRVSQDGVLGGSIAISNDGGKIYSDNDYSFSFKYPQDFSVGAFSDVENTKTILVQNAEKTAGIQIYISSFGEDITLTPQRIKKDVPDIAMSDVQTVSIGQSSPERSDLKAGTPRSDLVTAVSFKTGNAGADKSREVWFVYKSDLYQISAPQLTSPDLGDLKRSGEVLLDGIINTWKWSDIK